MELQELQKWIKENCFYSTGRFKPHKIQKNPQILELIIKLTNFLDEALLSQRCWHILNNCFYYNMRCLHCGKNLIFKRFSLGYGLFCSKSCQLKSTYTIQKIKQTKLERYGDENYNNMEKNKETCLNKYGVDSYSKTSNFKRKCKQTKLKRYGVRNFVQSSIFLEKSKKTRKERYNDETFVNVEKRIKTNLKKYNVKNVMQNPYISEICNYKKSWHDYVLPSGKIINLQGYEPKAMDILLSSYNEDEILFKRSEVPEIWYLKSEDTTWHRYFSDFYIPKDNLIVEVKSTFTYEKYLIVNLDKQDACLQLGYNYRLIIL